MIDKIISLLDIQKQARDAKNIAELGFVVTNKTQNLISYDNAIFWTANNLKITLEAISGNSILDKDSPYAQYVVSEIKKYIQNTTQKTIQKITPEKNENDFVAKNITIVPMKSQDKDIIGGLWIERQDDLTQPQQELLSELSEGYSLCLSLIKHRQNSIFSFINFSSLKLRYIVIASIVIFLFPVRLNITAPAEIIASSTHVITMPYDAPLNKIMIKPGDNVNEGDLLATIDKTLIQSQKDSAEQVLKNARSALSRAGFESLQSGEKKSDLQLLRSEIKTKTIEFNYANDLLAKADIKSPVSGVAIFSDASSLQGKPMRMGERIMTIANPNDIELLIRVPAQSIIPIEIGENVSYFLNTSPLSSQNASVRTIGYQADTDEDGLLTYKIRATIHSDNAVRIGWKGTAKIKGQWSIFGYSLMRRPLIALRNLAGF